MNDVAESNNPNVQLLACLVDRQGPDSSQYRFLVDGKYVKYADMAHGTISGDESEDDSNWCFGPVLLSELLPPFPPGNWNQGYLAKDERTGEVAFTRTEIETLPEVKNLWHSVRLNELDFFEKTYMKQRVHNAKHPGINDGKQAVCIKYAVWPWEIDDIENETMIYKDIHDKGIGPRFLGHLAEGKDGRVIGFVTEWVQDARPAEPGDLERCKEALGRLHKLGIKLGDTNKYNFLVREDDVVLVDFETAKKCSAQELENEMNSLEASLLDTSRRGGPAGCN